MKLFEIKINDNENYNNWNIDDKFLSECKIIENYNEIIIRSKIENKSLIELKSEEILDFFDGIVEHWLTGNDRTFLNLFSNLGISFLMSFLRKNNLKNLLKESLNGNINYLDDFHFSEKIEKHLLASPRGIVTHWLAGNVPVLGMISLSQGLITKNIKILK